MTKGCLILPSLLIRPGWIFLVLIACLAAVPTPAREVEIIRDIKRVPAGRSEIHTIDSSSSIPLNGLPIIKMTADFARPYIYAVEEEGVTARVLVINTETESIEQVLSVGSNVTDLDIHYPEARLYLNNYLRPETQRVNLHTLNVESPLLIDDEIGRVEAGRQGRLYVRVYGYYGYEYWVIDTATGAKVGEIPDYRDFEDSEADPTGRTMVLGDEGDSGTALHKYDISTDDPVRIRSSQSNPYGSETILMCGDGSKFFWNKTVYDDRLTELYDNPDEIFAATYRGHLAFSSVKAFDGFTGDLLAYLPIISKKMAVSGDQRKLFLWDVDADAIRVVSIADIAEVPALVPEPDPAHGSMVASPLMELSWSAMPHAQGYDVYLGDDYGQVAAATTASPTYQGRVADPHRVFEPPVELQLDTTLFWRVDVVSGNEAQPGPVWSFTTAPIRVSPNRIIVSGITGTPVSERVLDFSTTGSPITWSATVSELWLDLSSGSGATPAQVTVSFDTTGLPSGVHDASIDLMADGTAFAIPVRLELVHLRAVAMVSDRERPFYYILHNSGEGSNNSYLFIVRADTLELEKVIFIGTNATDLSINYPEGRLYINNSTQPRVRVVDLASLTEIAPLDIDMNVAVINAGRAGRIYVEDGYSWSDIAVVNSQTGVVINTFPGNLIAEGDGAVDPTGNTYFHGDGHRIFAFDISTDSPALIAEGPHSSSTIAFTLVLSADGQRVFYAGRLFDPGLNELAEFGVHAYALDTHGHHIVNDVGVIEVATGAWTAFLPVLSTVTAVSADDTRVIVTDQITGSIMTVDLPGPPLFSDNFEDGTTDAWTTTTGGA